MSRNVFAHIVVTVALAFLLAMIPPKTNVLAVSPEGAQPCVQDGMPCNAPAFSAIELQAEAPLTPGTRYSSYSGITFQPVRSDLGFQPIGASMYATAIVSGYGFVREFSLPEGAYLTEAAFFFIDNSADANIDLAIYAYDTSTGQKINLISTGSGTTNTSTIQVKSYTFSNPEKITNATKSYGARVEFTRVGSELQRLMGVRVGYTFNTYAPLVEKAAP